MSTLINSLPVLAVPFLACLLIASLHSYLGLHVLRRGVIFVDIALAQCAALGAAVALLLAPHLWPTEIHEAHPGEPAQLSEAALADQLAAGDDALGTDPTIPHSTASEAHAQQSEEMHGGARARFGYGMSLGFALLGAVLLSFGRFKDERVPHEAVIGIIFVVAAALSVLVLSKAPHGHEKMQAMLVGSILFTNWAQVGHMTLLYALLGAVHLIFRRQFIFISADVAGAEKAGLRVKLWDTLFFATFALMVTQSVAMAGVFVVFSYLIIPAACGRLLVHRFGAQLAVAWLVAALVTVVGLALSAVWDLPTGSTLVSCFGAALVVCALLRPWCAAQNPQPA